MDLRMDSASAVRGITLRLRQLLVRFVIAPAISAQGPQHSNVWSVSRLRGWTDLHLLHVCAQLKPSLTLTLPLAVTVHHSV